MCRREVLERSWRSVREKLENIIVEKSWRGVFFFFRFCVFCGCVWLRFYFASWVCFCFCLVEECWREMLEKSVAEKCR